MPKTIAEALALGRKLLQVGGIESYQLDARILLQEAGAISHDVIIADSDLTLRDEVFFRFENFIARRAVGEPVARILGRREFYGRDFRVTSDVLDPRADTETVIDLALPILGKVEAPRLLDLGAGSGAIIVTLLAELPTSSGVAVDISEAALAVVRTNASTNGVLSRLEILASDWYSAVQGPFDGIIANPPYVPAAALAELMRDVKDFDPHVALDGGVDGLLPYHIIAAGAGDHLAPGGVVMVEFGAGQGVNVAQIFSNYGFMEVARGIDLGGHLRCLAFKRAGY